MSTWEQTTTGTRTTLEIGDDLSELRRARAWVRDQVAALPAEQAEDVVLVADELVSNALRHGEAPRRLHVVRAAGVLRLEAEDGAAVPARPREGTTTGGRGMVLIAELAARWGQDLADGGKVVWAEFA